MLSTQRSQSVFASLARRFGCVTLVVSSVVCTSAFAEPPPAGTGAAPQQQPGFALQVNEAKSDLSNWDFVGLWGEASRVTLLPNGEGQTSPAWQCVAAERSQRVGKAYVTANFPPVQRNDIVEAQATYLIKRAPEDGSLYLLDIECRECGLPTKAGIRILVRNGAIRVNRSKLGLNEEFIAAHPSIRIGEPFTLTVRLKLGDENGETTVLVNDQIAIHSPGVNMPLSRIAASSGIQLKQEQFDYAQFGITANSGGQPAELVISNVGIKTSQ